MNQVQIAIIVIVAVIVLAIIAYYIYQENKFKKLIESNFNQVTEDVIQQEKGLIFENQELDPRSSFATSAKDKFASANKLEPSSIIFDPLLDSANLDSAPELNSFFTKFDQIAFSYASQINPELDHVVDLTWDKPAKLRMIPELSQFCSKAYNYYILEKGGNWCLFEKGKKYIVEGIKLVISLVDGDGVVSEFQLNNIYNELAKFALHHEGHIRQTDSLLQTRRIQQQLKSLANIELSLGLYIVNKDDIETRHLAKYFEANGFTAKGGVFEFRAPEGRLPLFKLSDENMQPFNPKGNYRILSLNAKLHQHEQPLLVLEKIFDFAEHYMQYFESRLLTTNKQLLGERDYLLLEKQVNNYLNLAKRQGAALGSALIERIYP